MSNTPALGQPYQGFQLATLDRTAEEIAADTVELHRLGSSMVRYPIYLTANNNLGDWISWLNTLLDTTDPLGMTVAVTFIWPDRNETGSMIRDVAQFEADWRAVATALRGYRNVWYDLVNEPANSDWPSIALGAAEVIREIDAVHPIVYALPGIQAQDADAFEPLPGITNQILEVHFYDWPELQFSKTKEYGSGRFTWSSLLAILSGVRSAALDHDVPAYVGEVAIDKDNPTAALFLKDFTQICRALGISLTVHAFREAPVWNYETNPYAWSELRAWLSNSLHDLDRDGIGDPVIWTNADGMWNYSLSSEGFSLPHTTQWGLPGDYHFIGDYNGDGALDFAIYREYGVWSYGIWPMWAVLYDYSRGFGETENYTFTQWGLPFDIPVPADYDGDGDHELVVWRPAQGIFYILESGTFVGGDWRTVAWGLPGDIPFAEDYDSDGETDLAVWRPSTTTYYFIPSSGVCPSGSVTHFAGCEQQ
ncbi:MAG: cellulase family glycosylhydrolase [bacterium]|nr:cellulase family glycosylhydrolase [bacterium]